MALEKISKTTNKYIKATDLNVGDTVSGYFSRIELKEGKYGTNENIVLLDKGSKEERVIFPAGNLKYFVKDFLDTNLVKPGMLVSFQREVDRKNQRGQTVTQYAISRDVNDNVEVPTKEDF